MTLDAPTPTTVKLKLEVAIRADASTRIGAGHVIRCLALAKRFRNEGHDVRFLMREAPGDLRNLVAHRNGFPVTALPEVLEPAPGRSDEWTDAQQTLRALADQRPDWIIVDHYDLGAHWEAVVATSGARVLAIDDHATRGHSCSIVVDHNLTPASAYAATTALNTVLLMGPRYALLRPSFTQHTTAVDPPVLPRTALVSFGGSDTTGQTLKALEAIQRAKLVPDRVIALTGRDQADLSRLRAMADEWPALEVHDFVDDPATLLQTADLAIGAGGVSALERLALGIPSIVLATASNQERPAEALAEEGAILYLGRASTTNADAITAAVDAMANRSLRIALRHRGWALVDGPGTHRVIRAMWQRTPVTMRPAGNDDRWRIHAWRNHPAIRATAIDPNDIPPDTHARWFDRVLTDPDRHLLVAEARATPIGVVRYDMNRPNAAAELSIFLAPDVLGLGLGKPALDAANAWMADHEPTITRIDAHVLGNNPRSLRLFESAGFHVQRTTLTYDQTRPTSADNDEPPRGGA